jgi:hypothetical protein
LQLDFQSQFTVDLHQLLVQPIAMQEPESSAHSRLDSKGLDQNATDLHALGLADRRGAWRWTKTNVGLFAVPARGHQLCNQGIAIYIVKEGKTISCQLTQ